MRAKTWRSLICAALLAWPAAAGAADTGGCDSFAWPLAKELAWLKHDDPIAVASGGEIASPPDRAIALALKPAGEAQLPVVPSGKPKAKPDTAYGGWVTFAGPTKPGIHQVTLATGGWVDVVQKGTALEATAHTGKTDCDGMRKSVRFDIGAGPFSVQFSGVPQDTIRFTLSRPE